MCENTVKKISTTWFMVSPLRYQWAYKARASILYTDSQAKLMRIQLFFASLFIIRWQTLTHTLHFETIKTEFVWRQSQSQIRNKEYVLCLEKNTHRDKRQKWVRQLARKKNNRQRENDKALHEWQFTICLRLFYVAFFSVIFAWFLSVFIFVNERMIRYNVFRLVE